MKGNSIYIICILVFLVILFAVEHNRPKKFSWIPTYSRYDKQPFGSAIFDDVVLSSLDTEYTICDHTLYQLAEDSTQNRNVLVVADQLQLGKPDVEAVLSMAEKGNKIMLVASQFGYLLGDTLGFKMHYGYFNIQQFKKYATSFVYNQDTICWQKDAVYNEAEYYLKSQLCYATFYKRDSLKTALAKKKDGSTIAIKREVGKGEVILVSTPLLFTNYGMLDNNNAALIFRLLTQLKGAPIVRTEAYGAGATGYEDETPFRYILSQPSLRWALYITMAVIVLFMVFTARRKQRPIPVVRKLENKTVEFVKLIGTLYFQKKDHTDLLWKKYVYFAETLRRNIQVDIDNEEDDRRLAQVISDKTGMDKGEIEQLFRNLRPVSRGERRVEEEEMKRTIDQMNKIINQL
ncbi:DUF4350 domain-containing protein [Bacteroides sp. 224]|uniref:DUF4350 domain-containing protein n=1 Tax=Bacteroides sp. 224 TaxID=2302936 RepID=UPI0013D6078F|nr:DUF4350 domain-containing protein [Bacteroides sp. 224]NDV66450.1 DUF4350 domain-containing protein [Bacteroides sp. 224]